MRHAAARRAKAPLFLLALLSLAACGSPGQGPGSEEAGAVSLRLDFRVGEVSAPGASANNIYVAWIEDDSGFIQNLVVCERLIKDPPVLTGTALPYWNVNVRPLSDPAELDAVTGATIRNQDFSLDARPLKDPSRRRFTAYFETDGSFDGNDWFTDQPAILYSAEVDLSRAANDYELHPVAWTRNENAVGRTPGDPTDNGLGSRNAELRYITDRKPFGTPDPNSALLKVAKVSLAILR
jgi:hypothetical protein